MIGVTASTLLTVGYEGRTAEEVAATLQAARVTVLVGVRLTPVSRKPGLSRRRLSERLDGEGIRYVHMPGLGNPRDNRAPLRASDPAAVDRFRDVMDSAGGAAGIEAVTALATSETVALRGAAPTGARCRRQPLRSSTPDQNRAPSGGINSPAMDGADWWGLNAALRLPALVCRPWRTSSA